jgi:hypothetical protein
LAIFRDFLDFAILSVLLGFAAAAALSCFGLGWYLRGFFAGQPIQPRELYRLKKAAVALHSDSGCRAIAGRASSEIEKLDVCKLCS